MKLSYRYLKSVVPWDIDLETIQEGFKILGLEVEDLQKRDRVRGSVFGKITEIRQATEKLHIAKIEIAPGKTIEVVINSDRVKPGQIYPVAIHGTRIGDVTVEPRNIRGFASEGAILSAQDFGVDPEILPQAEREGPWQMPDDTPLFTDPAESLWLSDSILDIKITPNHPEWLSLRGLLHEVAAILWRKTGKIHEVPSLETSKNISAENTCLEFRVDIEDYEDCQRYIGMLANVSVAPSGFETRRKLLASGTRPINNVVDASNLSMYEDGQPTHAFDADKIKSGVVRVARTKAPMKFKTLDDKERDLPVGTLMIWDGEKPVGIAGIMGGQDSEVTSATKRIFLESANFNPLLIAKSSSILGIRSEASTRFEKGADVEVAEDTAWKVISMIGTSGCAPVESYNKKERRQVQVRVKRMKKILGFDLDSEKIKEGLGTLGIDIKVGDPLLATIPGFRDNDLRDEIDLIEEAIRVIGYDTIPTTFPIIEEKIVTETPIFLLERRLKKILSGMGLYECVSKPMTCEDELKLMKLETLVPNAPKVLNPMTTDSTIMRPVCELGVLAASSYNARQGNSTMALFEVGSQFGPECRRLVMIMTGKRPSGWDSQLKAKETEGKKDNIENYDFFDLKGSLEALFDLLCVCGVSYRPLNKPHPHLHQYRQAEIAISGNPIGYIGQLDPEVNERLQVATPITIANINIENLLPHVPEVIVAKPVPRFPMVLRDIAVLAPETVPCSQIESTIKDHAGNNLSSIRLFDQFVGGFAREGKRSLAFSLSFYDPEGTLLGSQIDAIIEKIDLALEKIGASVRKA